jgi:dTDP-4-dehydrorhamnose 3,5-epimerase-like enzyme
MQQFASVIPHSLRRAENGDLGVIEFTDLPFEPKRIYWLNGVQGGQSRGHHAHKELRQFFVVIEGSVDIMLSDGNTEAFYNLTADGYGILLASGLWREIKNFSENAVLLVICDQPYSEDDYIREFDEYLTWTKNHE